MEEVKDDRLNIVKEYIEEIGINELPQDYRIFFSGDIITNYCCTINYDENNEENYILCSIRDNSVRIKAYYKKKDIIAIFQKDNLSINLIKGQRRITKNEHVESMKEFKENELKYTKYELTEQASLADGFKNKNPKVAEKKLMKY